MKKIAALIASLLILTGCAQGATEEAVENGIPVKFFFVSDTPRGFKLFSEVQPLTTADDLNLQVVSDLVSGKVVPLDPEYANLWGGTNTVNSVQITDSVATVDLGEISLNVGAEGEQLSLIHI